MKRYTAGEAPVIVNTPSLQAPGGRCLYEQQDTGYWSMGCCDKNIYLLNTDSLCSNCGGVITKMRSKRDDD